MRPNPGATKPPFARGYTQTCSHGVTSNVIYGVLKMLAVSNVTIKIVLKPKSSLPSQYFVSFLRSIRLDRMHDIRQRICETWRCKQMHMIRHYDPLGQPIANAIKVKQCVLHHVSYPSVRQKTVSVALIQVGLDSPSQFSHRTHLIRGLTLVSKSQAKIAASSHAAEM
jgi:hypothetical protein